MIVLEVLACLVPMVIRQKHLWQAYETIVLFSNSLGMPRAARTKEITPGGLIGI